ncbi:hypothetical protein D3C78_1103860 [compost metagenome]
MRFNTSHREQLVDQSAGTVHAGNQIFERCATIFFTLRFHQVLGMHPEHGEWCTHFVSRVSDKAPLTPHYFLNLREHSVEGCLHGLKLSG